MKPVDIKSSIYIDTTRKDPKYKIEDIARKSKYKNIFVNVYTLNWPEKVFLIKKVKDTEPCTCVINELNGEELVGTFYEK